MQGAPLENRLGPLLGSLRSRCQALGCSRSLCCSRPLLLAGLHGCLLHTKYHRQPEQRAEGGSKKGASRP